MPHYIFLMGECDKTLSTILLISSNKTQAVSYILIKRDTQWTCSTAFLHLSKKFAVIIAPYQSLPSGQRQAPFSFKTRKKA